MPTVRRRSPFLALIALGIAASVSPVVGAQGGPPQQGEDRAPARRGGFFRGAGGFNDLVQPEFLTRDLPLFVEELDLDEGQKTIVEAILADYVAAFELGVEPVSDSVAEITPRLFQTFFSPEIREKFQSSFQDTEEVIRRRRDEAAAAGRELSQEDVQAIIQERIVRVTDQIREMRQASGAEAETQKVMGELIEKVDGWRSERDRMRVQFIESVQAQLRENQQTMWPAFERLLDREKTLPRGQISGESVDLLRVLDSLELEEADFAKTASVRESYELRLAQALKARNEFLSQSEPRLLRAMQSFDVKTGIDIVKKQVALRVALRDVNEEFRPIIAAELPEAIAPEFTREALMAGYERAFRPTRADEVFAWAQKLELEDSAVEQLRELELLYQQELDVAGQKLVATMKKEEPQEQIRQAERFAGFLTGNFGPGGPGGGGPGGGFGGGRGQDPVRTGIRERRDVGEKYIERIAAVLTPEQAAEMPQPERRGGGGGLDNLPPEMRERVLEQVDTNKNGQIDPEEQEAATRMFRDRFRRGADGREAS